MSKVLACCDAFKGTLSAVAAGESIARAVLRCKPDAQIRNIPLSDGGAGFLDAMVAAMKLGRVECTVTGPLGAPVVAEYGLSANGDLAVIEMARAAGLPLVPDECRDPLRTTSFGVGEMMKHAVAVSKCKDMLIGLGGSATNDGGVPALQALGLDVFVSPSDAAEQPVPATPAPRPLCGADLERITKMEATSSFDEFLSSLRQVTIVSDVTNILVGPQGATRVYGPQKGAKSEEVIQRLEAGLANAAAHAERVALARHGAKPEAIDLRNMRGAGAAGGMGGFFTLLLDAKWCSGAQLVAELVRLEDHVRWADVVITGEGSFDDQTLEFGKTLSVVEKLCAMHNKPMVVVCGQHAKAPTALGDASSNVGTSVVVLPLTPVFSRDVAMREAARCIEAVVEAAVPLLVEGNRNSAVISAHVAEKLTNVL